MLTRKLTNDDSQQFAEVFATAYISDASTVKMNPKNEFFGTFTDDNLLISQMECGYLDCFYGNSKLKCATIGGVASRPESRRMGGVRLTFDAVFENAINNGCHISALHPFSIAYYRKFGYEVVFRYITARCTFKAFQKLERFTDVTIATEKGEAELTDVYQTIAKKNNLMPSRSTNESFCLNPYTTCRYTYFVNDGNSKGYILITPNRSERIITVDEICFTDKNAALKLLGFLRTYDGNYDTVIFEKLPITTPVLSLLDDENRLITRNVYYGCAARILDIESVLKANNYPDDEGVFTIKSTDEQIKANNGFFTVRYKNGGCTVTVNETTDYDIALDAPAAARLLLGKEGLTLDEISYIDNIEIKTDCKDFLRAFRKTTTQFYEAF